MNVRNQPISQDILTLLEGQKRLEGEMAALKELVAEKDRIIAEKDKTIAQLNAQLDWMRRQIFGKKSERSADLGTNGQFSFLFGEGIDPGTIVEDTITEGHTVTIDQFTRTTGRTKTHKATFDEIIDNLPQNRIEISASEEERICPECGGEMSHLGWEKVRSEVIVIPARYEANVYYAEALKCENCQDDEHTVIVKTNHVPDALIPHSLASETLVANIAMMKYGLYVPNYRLEKYILLQGVKLTRESMSYQLIYVCEYYLVVIYEWLHAELKKRGIINADETTGKVNNLKELAPLTDACGNLIDKKAQKAAQQLLDAKAKRESEAGKPMRKKIYMWMYSSRYGTDLPIVLYDYQPSRAGECCERFLGVDYDGYLILDGYSGYNGMKASTRCCCIAHFRRYWFEAIKTKTGPLDETDPAVRAFMFSNKLFHIERELAGLPPEERKQKRLEQEKPLWNEFWEWQKGLEASGGSPLQKALTYARNHRDTLENYMLDGNLPMTNAYAELQAKAYATGRKNFLFHQSAEGARSAAILMSLIESAKANQINPELYLAELLRRRSEYIHCPEKREEFAPWSDRMKRTCAIKNKQENAVPNED